MKQKTSKDEGHLRSADVAELFSELAPAVYGYALRMLGDPGQAEDVSSETFLRVHSRREQYRERGSVKSWVLGIAHRLCIDVIRKRVRQTEPVRLSESLTSPEASPADRSEKNEQDKIIAAAIEKLPAEQKEVVMLKVYGQLTFREISDSLNIPLNTALGRMHLATKRLALDPSLVKIGRNENGL